MPTADALHFVDIMKRLIISSMRFVVKVPLTPKRFTNAIASWLGEMYASVFRGASEERPEGDYSQSSREFLRTLRAINTHTDDKWCRYLTEIWETDMAYRNRGQDIFPLVDLDALEKNTRKEVLRLFTITCEREVRGGQLPKMAALGKILRVALFFPRFRRMMRAFFFELNMDEIKVSIEDRYWNANKFDYNYEGKSYGERMVWRAEEEKGWKPLVVAPEKPRITVNEPNKAFYDLPTEDAEKVAEEVKQALLANHQSHVA